MGRDTNNPDASPISHRGHVCVCPQTTTDDDDNHFSCCYIL